MTARLAATTSRIARSARRSTPRRSRARGGPRRARATVRGRRPGPRADAARSGSTARARRRRARSDSRRPSRRSARSATSRRTMQSCWKSFSPKYAPHRPGGDEQLGDDRRDAVEVARAVRRPRAAPTGPRRAPSSPAGSGHDGHTSSIVGARTSSTPLEAGEREVARRGRAGSARGRRRRRTGGG